MNKLFSKKTIRMEEQLRNTQLSRLSKKLEVSVKHFPLIDLAPKHLIASIVLIVGYATGGTVFLQVSFLELCPAYYCSENADFSNSFKCSPHKKDNLIGFCDRKDLYHRVDWSDPTSLRNWYT